MSLGKCKYFLNLKYENIRIEKECNNILEIIKNHTNKLVSNMSVLDVGCGDGFFVFGLSPHFKTVYGLEPDKDLLKCARNNRKYFKRKNIRFYEGSVENNPLIRKFDIILFTYSLHFTKNSYKSLEIISKNLKKDGIIVVIEPNKEFISKRLDIKSNEFNRKYYNKKQKMLKKTKDNVNIFSKKHILVYKIFNRSNFIALIKINN